MSIGDLIRSAVDRSKAQFLHDCALGARAVKRKRDSPAHTRIEFGTTNMSVDDLLYFDRNFGGGESRKPQHVGIILWVPFEAYERAIKHDELHSGSPEGGR